MSCESHRQPLLQKLWGLPKQEGWEMVWKGRKEGSRKVAVHLEKHHIQSFFETLNIIGSVKETWRSQIGIHHFRLGESSWYTHGMDHAVNEPLKRGLQQNCSLSKIARNGKDDSGNMMLVQRIISPFAFLVLSAKERQISLWLWSLFCISLTGCFKENGLILGFTATKETKILHSTARPGNH